jgi:heat shock protein HslJ
MTKQTIFSFSIIIIVAVALFFGIRAMNNAPYDQAPYPDTVGTMPADSDIILGNPSATNNPPTQPAEIVGKTWGWKHNIIGGDAVVAPNNPEKFTVTFGADGTISGTTDCNGFGGDYTLMSDGTIAFGPFMSTLMYCDGSQEADFTQSLVQATRLTIDAEGNLVVVLGNTSNVMVFEGR